jgi:hypothetical protein
MSASGAFADVQRFQRVWPCVREYFGREFVGKDIELCRSWKKVEFAMSVLMSANV